MSHELETRIDLPLTPDQKAKLNKPAEILKQAALKVKIPAHGKCIAQNPTTVDISKRGFEENGVISIFLEAHTNCPTTVKNRCWARYEFDSKVGLWERPKENM